VDEIEQKEVQVKPQPPFSTSTLQRDAKSKLHVSVKQTAAIAQSLFAKGKITYIRTDSTELSPECFEAVKAYIYREYGESYYNGQQYKTKIVNAQEAHEAIRPTYITEPELDDSFSSDEQRLYRLIWARTIASQMKNGIDDVVNMFTKMTDVDSKTTKELDKYRYKTLFKKVKYDGFRVIYGVDEEAEADDVEAQTLSIVPTKGSEVDYSQITLYENFSGIPYRYDDARLVQEFEKRGIGRPSTSANMVTYIQEKGYVEVKNVEGVKKKALVININKKKGSEPELTETTNDVMIGNENKKLVPTSTGVMIVEFLEEKFKFIMDYNFTKEMEAELDDISNGKSTSLVALQKFYDNLAPIVSELQSGGRQRYAKDERFLGIVPNVETETPSNTEPVYKLSACIGKYGPCVMKYTETDGKKENVEYASINAPFTVETITLEDAIKLFGFPRKVGTINRKHVTIGRSKYGFYAKVGTEYTQLDEITDENMAVYKEKTDDELLTIVKAAIAAKVAKKEEAQKEANKKVLKKVTIDKKEYMVNVGQYGLYFYTKPEKKGVKPQFYSVPKEYTAENIDTLTVDKMKEIMAAPPKPRFAKKDDTSEKPAGKRVSTRTYRRPKKETEDD
jgi:DNA topoisomerase-1